jgi:polysaccharide pyruvyl transferase WcaK-like protein
MIHHVFANRSNIGDWLSARGIQSLLKPLEVEEHLCDDPFVAETLARLSKAGPGDLIVIGGGGLFMDYFEPFWRGFRTIADRVPFCIWGAGYCDLKLEESLPASSLIEAIIKQSSLCVVRDELTREHLQNLALPEPVICPSVSVINEQLNAGPGVLHVDNYSTAGAAAYDAMCAAGEAFAARTNRKYRQTNNHIKGGDEQALRETLDLYAASDVILSSALHGCIIGVAMGRKVLAVSGDYKIEAFMHTAGLSDWVCDISELNAIGVRLDTLVNQPTRTDFLAAAGLANQSVANSVKSIYARHSILSQLEIQKPEDVICA